MCLFSQFCKVFFVLWSDILNFTKICTVGKVTGLALPCVEAINMKGSGGCGSGSS